MKKHSCLCLQCGRAFEIALSEDTDINEQACPICDGRNIVEHRPDTFLRMLFGGGGGT